MDSEGAPAAATIAPSSSSTTTTSIPAHPLLTLQALNAGPSSSSSTSSSSLLVSAHAPSTNVASSSALPTPAPSTSASSAQGPENGGLVDEAMELESPHPFQAREERYDELCRSLNLDEETRKIGWSLLRRLTLKAGQQDEVRATTPPLPLHSCISVKIAPSSPIMTRSMCVLCVCRVCVCGHPGAVRAVHGRVCSLRGGHARAAHAGVHDLRRQLRLTHPAPARHPHSVILSRLPCAMSCVVCVCHVYRVRCRVVCCVRCRVCACAMVADVSCRRLCLASGWWISSTR